LKNVLCYGDSNTWGCIPIEKPTAAPRRFERPLRWPGVLARELGDEYWIVEEGLNGRTTIWDDELEPHRNGRDLLAPALLTHQPLDVVIVMLGTNDLKRRIGVSAPEIAEGAGALADIVSSSDCGPDGRPPEVLVVCPPPVGRLELFADDFDGAAGKSPELARCFDAMARARSIPFFDAGAVVSSSDVDGIHLDEPAHARLGVALADRVRALLGG
jgi:lysophospholipase L1-like esterase